MKHDKSKEYTGRVSISQCKHVPVRGQGYKKRIVNVIFYDFVPLWTQAYIG